MERSIQGLQRQPGLLLRAAARVVSFGTIGLPTGNKRQEERAAPVPVIFLPGVLVQDNLVFFIQYLFKQVEQFRFYRYGFMLMIVLLMRIFQPGYRHDRNEFRHQG